MKFRQKRQIPAGPEPLLGCQRSASMQKCGFRDRVIMQTSDARPRSKCGLSRTNGLKRCRCVLEAYQPPPKGERILEVHWTPGLDGGVYHSAGFANGADGSAGVLDHSVDNVVEMGCSGGIWSKAEEGLRREGSNGL